MSLNLSRIGSFKRSWELLTWIILKLKIKDWISQTDFSLQLSNIILPLVAISLCQRRLELNPQTLDHKLVVLPLRHRPNFWTAASELMHYKPKLILVRVKLYRVRRQCSSGCGRRRWRCTCRIRGRCRCTSGLSGSAKRRPGWTTQTPLRTVPMGDVMKREELECLSLASFSS